MEEHGQGEPRRKFGILAKIAARPEGEVILAKIINRATSDSALPLALNWKECDAL